MSIFSVDFLLPVQVGDDWVGVVFRDNECAMALMDHYDVSNKAILCNPSFDEDSVNWFQNSYDRLRIVIDDARRNAQHGYSGPPRSTTKGTSSDLNVLGLTPASGHTVIPEVASMGPISMEHQMSAQSQNRMRSQNMSQSQMMAQCQMTAQMARSQMAAQAQSLISAESRFETPALPTEPLTESKSADQVTSEQSELDYLLFGSGPSAQRSVYGLTPAPHSQNWDYHRKMKAVQNMGTKQMGPNMMGQTGWGQMGMSNMGMGQMRMSQMGMRQMGMGRMSNMGHMGM